MGNLAREMGFTHVSLSSEVMPMVKAVPRGFTTAADAYLTPVIARYVKSFRSGFDQVWCLAFHVCPYFLGIVFFPWGCFGQLSVRL